MRWHEPRGKKMNEIALRQGAGVGDHNNARLNRQNRRGSQAKSSKRDSFGRFAKGNAGGPGRPPLAAELPFIEGVKAAASAEKVAQVLDKLCALALKGNVQAAALY